MKSKIWPKPFFAAVLALSLSVAMDCAAQSSQNSASNSTSNSASPDRQSNPQAGSSQTPNSQSSDSKDPRFGSDPQSKPQAPGSEDPRFGNPSPQQAAGTDPRFGNTRPDPSQGPFDTIPGKRPAPEVTTAPSAVHHEEEHAKAPEQALPQAPIAAAPAPESPTTLQDPLGTATAERGTVRGGAASRPAGMAIAPVKQRQMRSYLIRVGAIAASAVALGTVYALSKGSPARPPGAVK